jgi:hypothetical protein
MKRKNSNHHQHSTKRMVVAMPTMNDNELQFLQTLRKMHDPKGHAVLGPHFTLFPLHDKFSRDELKTALETNLRHQMKINVCMRLAMFMPPLYQHKSWYAFLIPDEGFSCLSRLHQLVYSGKLHSALDKKFPFIPHITIGSFGNKEDCLQLVGQFNAIRIQLSGYIEKLLFIETCNDKLIVFDELHLR